MSRIPKILRQARPNFRTAPRYGTELRNRVVVDQSRFDLASKYFVTDLPGATITATRLHNILDNLEQGRPLPLGALTYLQQHGLFALQHLARGKITYEAFSKAAAEEQAKREKSAEAERQKEEAAWLLRIEDDKAQEAIRNAKYERDRQFAEEARRKQESDPKYISKMKNQQLLAALWDRSVHRKTIFCPYYGHPSSSRRWQSSL